MHFLMHIAEESNGFCNAQNKKTVCPDHVLDALIVSSFVVFASSERSNKMEASKTI